MSDNLSNDGRSGTFCLSKAGLTVGGTSTGVAIVAPNGAGVDYCIDGVLYHKADAATVAITAATAQAVSTTCIYLVCLDASGNLTTVKGTDVTTTDISGGDEVITFPEPTASSCPIGYIRVATNASTTFTAGTTALDAAGITDTYVDLFSLPSRPISS
jgi:hypothetical protein